ncbi:MAG: InlB B-repeat-containing protein [Fibromonadaceae bacterium]|jgi:uncharacterized repeat protein (TIGR02543 family)|nr:InlB B-repeat-containing protein [Fibromonadaceae bacterium]
MNKLTSIAFAMALALSTNAHSQAVKIDNFAEGSGMATIGEIWFNFVATNGSGSTASISNDGKPINTGGYAEIKDVKLSIPSWEDWAQASIGLETKNNGVDYDLAQCSNGFSFTYKGWTPRFSLNSEYIDGGGDTLQVTHYYDVSIRKYDFDCNCYGAFSGEGSDEVTISKTNFSRDNYDAAYIAGHTNIPLNLSEVKSIHWTVLPGSPGYTRSTYLQISNFKCLGDLDLSNVPPIYVVTFNSNGGSVAGNGKQYVKNGSPAIEPSAPTRAGHTFEGWLNGETAFDFTTPITRDLTLTAKWKEVNTPIRLPQIAGNNIHAYAKGNSIILQNLPQNAKVEVYNLNGKRIYSAHPENPIIGGIGVQTIAVHTKGMYIVKVGRGVSNTPNTFLVAVK